MKNTVRHQKVCSGVNKSSSSYSRSVGIRCRLSIMLLSVFLSNCSLSAEQFLLKMRTQIKTALPMSRVTEL